MITRLIIDYPNQHVQVKHIALNENSWNISLAKACFTLIVRPFDRALLSWETERRDREAERRQFHTESHLT